MNGDEPLIFTPLVQAKNVVGVSVMDVDRSASGKTFALLFDNNQCVIARSKLTPLNVDVVNIFIICLI